MLGVTDKQSLLYLVHLHKGYDTLFAGLSTISVVTIGSKIVQNINFFITLINVRFFENYRTLSLTVNSFLFTLTALLVYERALHAHVNKLCISRVHGNINHLF